MKKNILKAQLWLLLAGSMSLVSQMVHAQASAYTFSATTSVYTPITGGTVFGTGIPDSYASPSYTFSPGFTFAGTTYTVAYMTSNGLLNLGGTSAPSSTEYNAIANTTGSGISICPFNADLKGSSASGATPEMRAETVGNEQVFQWKDIDRYNIGDRFDIQVRLNTSNGSITFIYGGTMTVGTSTSYFPVVGIRSSTSDWQNLKIGSGTETWAAPLPGTTNADNCRFTSSSTNPKSPAIGQTYIYTPPTCPVNSTATISGISTGSAIATWTAGGSETQWDLYYGVAPLSAPTASTAPTATTSTTSYTLNGLSSSATYNLYVRANCGGGNSLWTPATVFATACLPINTFPYTESFSASLPPCWNATEGTSGASYHWEPVTSDNSHGAAGPQAGTHFMRMYVFSANSSYNAYNLTTSAISLPATPKQLSYYYFLGATGYKGTTGANGSDPYPLSVQISTDNGLTWTSIYNHTNSNSVLATSSSTLNWQQNAINLSAYANQTVLFRFATISNFGSGYCNQGLDEMTISDLPACLPPATTSYSNVTHNSVNVQWTIPTGGTPTNYIWEVRATGAPGSGSPAATGTVSAASLSVAVSGLTPSTTYSVYITSDCNGSNSSWTTPMSFSTPCAPNTIYPMTESVGTSFSPCWYASEGSTGASYHWESVTSDAAHGISGPYAGSNFFRLNVYNASTGYNAYNLTTQPYALPAAPKQLTYYYYLGSTGNNGVGTSPVYPLTIQVSTDNGLTWTDLYNHSGSNSVFSTTNALSNWDVNSVSLAAYAGQTVQLRFKSISNYGSGFCNQALDEITIEDLPTCFHPTGLSLANPTPTGVTASWTAPVSGTPVGYNWEVRTAGAPGSGSPAASGSVSAASTSVTISGLNPLTNYTVYVQSDCGGGGHSAWAIGKAFLTPCQPPVLSGANNVTRCGVGTVTLTAATGAGSTVTWYNAQANVMPIATGSVYVTPQLSNTTTYYVAAASIGSSISAGQASLTGTSNGYSSDYLVFDAYSDFLLDSVDIYPYGTGTGTVSIALQDANGNTLQSTNIVCSGTNTAVGLTVPIGFYVSAGTDYRLSFSSASGSITQLYRNTSGTSFPYTVPTIVSIKDGSSGYYNYFYDWKIRPICETGRVGINAVVSPAPVVSTNNPAAICAQGGVATLSVTSNIFNYDTYTWSPATDLYNDATLSSPYQNGSNSPIVYLSSTTTGVRTYSLTGYNSINQCIAFDTVKTNIIGVDFASVTASAISICSGDSLELTATAHIATAGTLVIGGTTSTSSSAPTPFNGGYGGSKGEYILTASELTSAGLVAGNISSLGIEITATGANLNDFAVGIATTTLSTFGTSMNIQGSTSIVYSTTTFTPVTGLNNFPFSAPFYWDGASNLLISLCWSNVNYSNNSSTIRIVSTSNYSSQSFRQDNTPAATLCATTGTTNPGGSFTSAQSRPAFSLNGYVGSIGAGSLNWSWNPGAINSHTASVNPLNGGSSPITQTYTVTAIDPVTTCSNVATQSVTVNPLPVVMASASNTAACSGTSVVLSANGGVYYSWAPGGAVGSPVFVTPNSATTYTLSGSNGSCTGHAYITIQTQTAPSVNIAASSMTVCPGLPVTLTASGTPAYAWFNGATTASVVVNPTVTTTYSVTGNDPAVNCPGYAMINITISPCTGVEEWNATGYVHLYPNPSNGHLTLALSETMTKAETRLSIYDVSGKLIFQRSIAENLTALDLSALGQGMYYAEVAKDGQIIHRDKLAISQ